MQRPPWSLNGPKFPWGVPPLTFCLLVSWAIIKSVLRRQGSRLRFFLCKARGLKTYVKCICLLRNTGGIKRQLKTQNLHQRLVPDLIISYKESYWAVVPTFLSRKMKFGIIFSSFKIAGNGYYSKSKSHFRYSIEYGRVQWRPRCILNNGSLKTNLQTIQRDRWYVGSVIARFLIILPDVLHL